jgi:uncharacterized membrane protein
MEGPIVKVDRTAVAAVLLIAAVAAIQLVHYSSRLPATLAVHFNVSGAADGWSSRTGFIFTYGAIEAAVAVFSLTFAFLAGRLPASAVNIPNRDYWLSPERSESTISFLWGRVLWLEATTLAFLVAVAEIIFRLNLSGGAPTLPSRFFTTLAVFVITVGWQAVSIVIHFRRRGPSLT